MTWGKQFLRWAPNPQAALRWASRRAVPGPGALGGAGWGCRRELPQAKTRGSFAAPCSAALHCNHRWALDGCDPASYAGVLWCFGKQCLAGWPWRLPMLRHACGPTTLQRSSHSRLLPHCRHVRRAQGCSRHPSEWQRGDAVDGGARAAPAASSLCTTPSLIQLCVPGTCDPTPQHCVPQMASGLRDRPSPQRH